MLSWIKKYASTVVAHLNLGIEKEKASAGLSGGARRCERLIAEVNSDE